MANHPLLEKQNTSILKTVVNALACLTGSPVLYGGDTSSYNAGYEHWQK